MAIERCVVKGTIASLVETRTVFTADVYPSESDSRQELWEVYLDSIYSPMTNIIANAYHLYEYELFSLNFGKWEPIQAAAYSPGFGPSGDFLPNAVAAVLIGIAPGRRHQGRKFFSVISDGFATGNSLATAAATYAAAALLAYVTPVTTLSSAHLDPGVVDKDFAFHGFTSGLVSSYLGSMRRRKPGNGM